MGESFRLIAQGPLQTCARLNSVTVCRIPVLVLHRLTAVPVLVVLARPLSLVVRTRWPVCVTIIQGTRYMVAEAAKPLVAAHLTQQQKPVSLSLLPHLHRTLLFSTLLHMNTRCLQQPTRSSPFPMVVQSFACIPVKLLSPPTVALVLTLLVGDRLS